MRVVRGGHFWQLGPTSIAFLTTETTGSLVGDSSSILAQTWSQIAMSESPEVCQFSSTEAISQHCYNVSASN